MKKPEWVGSSCGYPNESGFFDKKVKSISAIFMLGLRLVLCGAVLAFETGLRSIIFLIRITSVLTLRFWRFFSSAEPLIVIVYLFLGGILCVLSFFCRFS